MNDKKISRQYRTNKQIFITINNANEQGTTSIKFTTTHDVKQKERQQKK